MITGRPLAIGVFIQVLERFAAQFRCVLAKFFFYSTLASQQMHECGCGSFDLPKVMSYLARIRFWLNEGTSVGERTRKAFFSISNRWSGEVFLE